MDQYCGGTDSNPEKFSYRSTLPYQIFGLVQELF